MLFSRICGVEADKRTADAVPDTNDSTGGEWVGIDRSGPATIGLLARRCDLSPLPFLTVRSERQRRASSTVSKDCDRTFNDKTATIIARSKVALRKWLFSIYAFLRFNTSVHQFSESTDAPLYRRVGLTVVNTLTNLGLRLAFATPHITDTQSGFRVYDAAAIETISQTETLSEGMDASIDILFKTARDDHDIIEIPIDITYDVEDANTHHPVVQGLVLLVNILSRLYSVRPGLLLTTFATLCLVVGGGLALAVLSTSLLTRAALVLIATVCLFLSVILLRTVFGLDNQASE